MRVESKYKEPYDNIIGHYTNDLVFRRKLHIMTSSKSQYNYWLGFCGFNTSIIEEKNPFTNRSYSEDNGIQTRQGYFVLAGVAYPFVAIVRGRTTYGTDSQFKIPNEEACKVLTSYNSFGDWTFCFNQTDFWVMFNRLKASHTQKHGNHLSLGFDWNAKDNIPVLKNVAIGMVLYDREGWTIYDNFSFSMIPQHNLWSSFKLHDVYQEIYRFLANKAVNTELPQVANDVRIQQHGFDLKKSFRKRKKGD